jgi:hypothetical protein
MRKTIADAEGKFFEDEHEGAEASDLRGAAASAEALRLSFRA